MNLNEIFTKLLNDEAQHYTYKLRQVLLIKDKVKRTAKNYIGELNHTAYITM